MDITINLAKPEDAADAYNIFKQTWLSTYPNKEHNITVDDILSRYPEDKKESTLKNYAEFYKNMNENFDSHPTIVWIAKIDGKSVGLVTVNREHLKQVGAIYVLPEYQGNGVGRKLFQTALGVIGDEPITINVATYNTKTIKFYESFGFSYLKSINDPYGALPSGAVIPEQMMIKYSKGMSSTVIRIKISALLINDKGELLITRTKGKTIWIALGGKVEGNESDIECLEREMIEEVGLKLIKASFLLETPIEPAAGSPGKCVIMKFYIIEEYQGEIKLNPQDNVEEIRWISKQQFENEVKKDKKIEIGSSLEFYAIPELIKRELIY